jgi:hypothetical protein
MKTGFVYRPHEVMLSRGEVNVITPFGVVNVRVDEQVVSRIGGHSGLGAKVTVTPDDGVESVYDASQVFAADAPKPRLTLLRHE